MRIAALICTGLLALAGCASSPATRDANLPTDADFTRYVVVTVRNDPAPLAPQAGSTVRPYTASAGYSLAPATRQTAKAIAAAHRLREASSWPIGLLGVHCVVFELPADATPEEALARLRRDPRVESAQPLQSFSALGSAPDGEAEDPYRKLQRNLDVMQIGDAHQWSRGTGVRIAVIDTGVDAAHPDLAGRITVQRDLVDGRSNANTSERHGTAVAGIIAAVADNGQGIAGIAPDAHIQALRACWTRADDPARAQCSTFTLAKALTAAIEGRAHIVNLSLGGPADPLLTRIVEAGMKRGVVFVGATPPHNSRHSFPTGIPGVIAANASGAGGQNADVETLFAPARDVLTLAPGARYDFMSGSSLAAASVSGAVALLLARDHTLDAAAAHALLAGSMHPIANPGINPDPGINPCAALATLLRQPICNRE